MVFTKIAVECIPFCAYVLPCLAGRLFEGTSCLVYACPVCKRVYLVSSIYRQERYLPCEIAGESWQSIRKYYTTDLPCVEIKGRFGECRDVLACNDCLQKWRVYEE